MPWYIMVTTDRIADRTLTKERPWISTRTTPQSLSLTRRTTFWPRHFAGGIPLKRDGKVVGAIGVNGGRVNRAMLWQKQASQPFNEVWLLKQ